MTSSPTASRQRTRTISYAIVSSQNIRLLAPHDSLGLSQTGSRTTSHDNGLCLTRSRTASHDSGLCGTRSRTASHDSGLCGTGSRIASHDSAFYGTGSRIASHESAFYGTGSRGFFHSLTTSVKTTHSYYVHVNSRLDKHAPSKHAT